MAIVTELVIDARDAKTGARDYEKARRAALAAMRHALQTLSES